MTETSFKTGFSFGLTSGVITTLGLMIGLHSGTQSKLAVLGGIITIAVADAFSDALGIHISQESQEKYSQKQIWIATVAAFFSKFIFALSFVVPIIFLQLNIAVLVSALWGILVISIFSYIMAKQQNDSPSKVIAEHLVITLIVILITHLVGDWTSDLFG